MLLDRSRQKSKSAIARNCLSWWKGRHGQGWQAEELLRANQTARTRFSPGRGQKVPLDKTLSSLGFPHLMTDPRYKKLAKLLVEYSTRLKSGDRIMLDMIDVPDEFTIELMRASRAVGAIPIVEARHTRISREIVRDTDQAHAKLVSELECSG